jgi:hypothetical protein
MHPQVILIVAQQRIADLRRAADHDRLLQAATTASNSHAVPAPRHAAAAPVSFLHWLRRLGPREHQAGDCK